MIYTYRLDLFQRYPDLPLATVLQDLISVSQNQSRLFIRELVGIDWCCYSLPFYDCLRSHYHLSAINLGLRVLHFCRSVKIILRVSIFNRDISAAASDFRSQVDAFVLVISIILSL